MMLDHKWYPSTTHGNSRIASGTPSTTSIMFHISNTTRTSSTINWSYFKLKVSGKPDKGAKTHLLRTNDWTNTHALQEGVKANGFFWALIGEV